MKKKYDKKTYFTRRILVAAAMIVTIAAIIILTLKFDIFAKDNKDEALELNSETLESKNSKDKEDSPPNDSKEKNSALDKKNVQRRVRTKY